MKCLANLMRFDHINQSHLFGLHSNIQCSHGQELKLNLIVQHFVHKLHVSDLQRK